MSRFEGTNERIYLSDDKKEWIEVVNTMSNEEFSSYMKFFDDNKEDSEKMLGMYRKLLSAVLRDWSFMDEKNEKVICSKESIDKLTIKSVFELTPLVLKAYVPEKKS